MSNINIDVKELEGRLLFAIPKKGRLYQKCQQLLEGADIQYYRRNRLDIALSTNLPVALIFLPAADIPKFVAEGKIDLGITGQDMIAESNVKVNQLVELDFGKCDLCVQVPITSGIKDPKELVGKRIVTSFTHLSKQFFGKLDEELKPEKPTSINYISGSVEVSCNMGLADGIVDLVESGETMRAAGLTRIYNILSTQAVLISNPHSKQQEFIEKIKGRIQGVIAASKYVYCTYNIKRSDLPKAVKITPGRKNPTISPLENDEWVSISVMVVKKECAEVMDKLEAIGATDIIIFNIDNCRT